jgi:hypothetical protein
VQYSIYLQILEAKIREVIDKIWLKR